MPDLPGGPARSAGRWPRRGDSPAGQVRHEPDDHPTADSPVRVAARPRILRDQTTMPRQQGARRDDPRHPHPAGSSRTSAASSARSDHLKPRLTNLPTQRPQPRAAAPAVQRPPLSHHARVSPASRTAIRYTPEDTRPVIMPVPDRPTKPQIRAFDQVLMRYRFDRIRGRRAARCAPIDIGPFRSNNFRFHARIVAGVTGNT